MVLPQKIKEIRLRNFLSQEEFAKRLGVSYATVNRWETGKTVPNIKALKKLDDYCKSENIDCDVYEFTIKSRSHIF